MFYLILAILSSAMISVFMRLSEKHISHNIGMLVVNYLICTVMAAFYTGTPQLFPRTNGLGTALWLGGLSGVLYLVAFVLMQWTVRKNGVVLPATFMKLGVVVPTLLSILLFRETPSVAQLIGFCGTAVAILLIHLDEGSGKAGSKLGLLVLLLLSGFTDFTAKFYEQLGTPELESHYLFYTFLVALALCIGLMLRKKQRIGAKELLFGTLVGIPNYFSARFLLLALGHIPAVAVYPTYSVGTIVAVTCAGLLLFREKLSKKRMAAMLVILFSLALLNLSS